MPRPHSRSCDSPPPPVQHLQDFLRTYSIPSDIKLSDPTWKQFFEEVVNRFKSARLHAYLADFLRVVGQKYREGRRPVDFLTDLLKLGVGNLLSGQSLGLRERVNNLGALGTSHLRVALGTRHLRVALGMSQ